MSSALYAAAAEVIVGINSPILARRSANWRPPAQNGPRSTNFIVAARSLGLGTTFTTFHTLIESELRELLGIPNEVRFGVMIPIGWPRDEFVKVKRKPIAKLISLGKIEPFREVRRTRPKTIETSSPL